MTDVLPLGWAKTTLGDILKVSSGNGLPKTKMIEGKVPVYGGNGITGWHNQANINQETIVIGRVGYYCGSIHLAPSNAWVTDNAFITKFQEEQISKDFLHKLLLATDLRKNDSSSAQPVISGGKIYPIEILLPPLGEQNRIAQKLDQLLAQVDTLKARVDAIPNILKRFRQSVLAAAVSGKLTEDWRGGSYKEYFEEDRFQWGKIPESWVIKLYPDVVESRLGKMLDKTKNTGVPTAYLGNINVRWFSFRLDELQEILISENEKMELSVAPGDVLICEGGEPGRCAIWKEANSKTIVFQKALHRARVKEGMLPEWLAFNLKRDADLNVLSQLFTGTTIKHLTGKALKLYPMRIPPVEEQKEIVRRVEQLLTFADQIEAKVTTAQNQINNLTQSILAKAFRGELVPQDPNDEPASALLERIKTLREAEIASKKKPKKKKA